MGCYLSPSLYTYLYIYMCKYVHIYIYICIYTYMWLWINTLVVAGLPPPLLQTFVAGPLLQTLDADLCVEYASLQGACRGGVCRKTPPSVTNLCREMAAQARYKANVFDSLPYLYMHMYIHGIRNCAEAARPPIVNVGRNSRLWIHDSGSDSDPHLRLRQITTIWSKLQPHCLNYNHMDRITTPRAK